MSTEIIHDFADVIMAYFDFANAPVATLPPANGAHNYPSTQIVVSPQEIRSLEGRVDSLSIEAEDKTLTYLTKKKIASSVVLVASVGIAAASVLSASPLIISITCVAMSAFACLSLYYMISSFMSYDLENHSVRANLRRDFRMESFNKISDQFGVDEIIGYDLLKERAELSSFEDKREYYAIVRALYHEKEVLESHREEDYQQAAEIFDRGTETFRRWLNVASSRLTYSATLKLLRERDQSRGRNDDEYRHISCFVNNYMQQVLTRKFEELMSPWRVWKQRERDAITTAHNNAIASLDRKFLEA